VQGREHCPGLSTRPGNLIRTWVCFYSAIKARPCPAVEFLSHEALALFQIAPGQHLFSFFSRGGVLEVFEEAGELVYGLIVFLILIQFDGSVQQSLRGMFPGMNCEWSARITSEVVAKKAERAFPVALLVVAESFIVDLAFIDSGESWRDERDQSGRIDVFSSLGQLQHTATIRRCISIF
jgi:hypothetical protein